MDDESLTIFWEIHQDLPREAPGDAQSTRRAFALLTDLPRQPRLLDIGCGPGRQALDLLQLTEGKITAIDSHLPYLKALQTHVVEQQLSERLEVLQADMTALEFPEHTFDVLWAEGAIYLIGFATGLQTWRPLLKPGGYLAVTELSWLKAAPPQEITRFWGDNYPAMQDVEANLASITAAGYQLIGHFALSDSAWWTDYYTPLEQRIARLRAKYVGNRRAEEVLAQEQREIDLYRQYSAYYGYVFYVMQA